MAGDRDDKEVAMKSRNRALRATLCLVLLLVCCVNTFAQGPSAGKIKAASKAPAPARKIPPLPKPTAPEGWPDGNIKLLQPRFAFGMVVKGAPYSATALTETTQTLGDGNQIIQNTEVVTYRDGEGRTRHEQTLRSVGRWVSEGEPLRIIFINDPVAGVNYTLNPRTRSASRRNYFNGKGPVKDGPPAAGASSDERKKVEALGTRVIEGLEAEGTRTTTITPAGEIGNRLPIEVTEERWYSPRLQTLVMRERRDPRSGDTVYRLTNINLNEPERSLFEVPADYTLRDETKPAAKPMKKPKVAQQ
jgi:hypothetical protein